MPVKRGGLRQLVWITVTTATAWPFPRSLSRWKEIRKDKAGAAAPSNHEDSLCIMRPCVDLCAPVSPLSDISITLGGKTKKKEHPRSSVFLQLVSYRKTLYHGVSCGNVMINEWRISLLFCKCLLNINVEIIKYFVSDTILILKRQNLTPKTTQLRTEMQPRRLKKEAKAEVQKKTLQFLKWPLEAGSKSDSVFLVMFSQQIYSVR